MGIPHCPVSSPTEGTSTNEVFLLSEVQKGFDDLTRFSWATVGAFGHTKGKCSTEKVILLKGKSLDRQVWGFFNHKPGKFKRRAHKKKVKLCSDAGIFAPNKQVKPFQESTYNTSPFHSCCFSHPQSVTLRHRSRK